MQSTVHTCSKSHHFFAGRRLDVLCGAVGRAAATLERDGTLVLASTSGTALGSCRFGAC